MTVFNFATEMSIIKKTILYGLLIFTCATASAIPTDSVFINMPDKILPLLNKKQRFEMAEYFKAGKADSTKNIFGNNAILKIYNTGKCHLLVVSSQNSTTELMRLLTDKNDSVYGVIQTVLQPIKYSSIQFYNLKWQRVNHKIALPAPSAWLNKMKSEESDTDQNQLNKIVQISYMAYSFDADGRLIVENNTLSSLSMEDKKLIEPIWENKTIPVSIFK